MNLERVRGFLLKIPSLFLGLFLFAVGVVMNLNSGLGMSPWGVFQVGLSQSTTLTLGQISQLVGLSVLVIGWAMGFPPGFATFMNMYFIGLFIDKIIQFTLIPKPTGLVSQFLLLLGGIIMIGTGSYFYLNPKLGAGPRDGLMMGLVRRTDLPVSVIRGGIEVTVLVLGYFLGGPVGVGTLVTALTIGYSVQMAFKLGGYDKKAEHLNLYQLARQLAQTS
ncbi:membrane protein [Candidatus Bathyarchaeota archaeon]|nr:membrane protein [Candidatus Bathyarchaeota archaeon]